jgi:hypothetical protein
LPLASIVFLAYIAIKSMLSAPAAQNYSLLGFLVVGLILLLVARFGWRSSFFNTRPESWTPESNWCLESEISWQAVGSAHAERESHRTGREITVAQLDARPLLIVISGPSGAGKGTALDHATRALPLRRIPTYTTRPMRSGEKNGIDYDTGSHHVSTQCRSAEPSDPALSSALGRLPPDLRSKSSLCVL